MKAVLVAAGVVAAALSAQDNGDGTTTVRADFLGKQGLLFLLR